MERGEDFIRETGTDVADCFVGFGRWVVAGKKEGAEDRCPFTFAVVGSQDDEIERVADAREVVFFDLCKVSSEIEHDACNVVVLPSTSSSTSYSAHTHFPHPQAF